MCKVPTCVAAAQKYGKACKNAANMANLACGSLGPPPPPIGKAAPYYMVSKAGQSGAYCEQGLLVPALVPAMMRPPLSLKGLKPGLCARNGFGVAVAKDGAGGLFQVYQKTGTAPAVAKPFYYEDGKQGVCFQAKLTPMGYQTTAALLKAQQFTLFSGLCTSKGYSKGAASKKVGLAGFNVYRKAGVGAATAPWHCINCFNAKNKNAKETCLQASLTAANAATAKLRLKALAKGTCASVGYTQKGNGRPLRVGTVSLLTFHKPGYKPATRAKVMYFYIDKRSKTPFCGQAMIPGAGVRGVKYFARRSKLALTPGSCASAGYTVPTTPGCKAPCTTMMGRTKFSLFSAPATGVVVAASSSYFWIDPKLAQCYEALLTNSAAGSVMGSFKEQGRNLAKGTCRSQGYTVAQDTKSLSLTTFQVFSVSGQGKPAQKMKSSGGAKAGGGPSGAVIGIVVLVVAIAGFAGVRAMTGKQHVGAEGLYGGGLAPSDMGMPGPPPV